MNFIVFYWDSKIFIVSVSLIASHIYCKIASFIEILLTEVEIIRWGNLRKICSFLFDPPHIESNFS